jgi:hypothetical protein
MATGHIAAIQCQSLLYKLGFNPIPPHTADVMICPPETCAQFTELVLTAPREIIELWEIDISTLSMNEIRARK